jgi:hypothetical protein
MIDRNTIVVDKRGILNCEDHGESGILFAVPVNVHEKQVVGAHIKSVRDFVAGGYCKFVRNVFAVRILAGDFRGNCSAGFGGGILFVRPKLCTACA